MTSDGGWSKTFIEHEVNTETVYLSVVFTWDLPKAYQRCVWLTLQKKRVVAGGPAVALIPHYLADVAEIGQHWDGALELHNPQATFTSRGCVRRCPFCAVWRTEGRLQELIDWPVKPIICDNNLLACSRRHFDDVIDKLKGLDWCDFNQGLDARLLTKHHAGRIAELKKPTVRLAFDHVRTEPQFMAAWDLLRNAGIPARRIRVYVLIGYDDTPEDALYRLRLVQFLGTRPNPMRYNPLDSLTRNNYVGPNWTDFELKRYHKYWSRLRWYEHIPFGEFRNEGVPDLSRSWS